METSSARCIVCGRELPPDGDPLVCDTCPSPPVDARALPPLDPGDPTRVPPRPGLLAGMAARPRRGAAPLSPVESIGLGFAAAALATVMWFQLGVAANALLPVAAIGVGVLVGAAFGFDAAFRVRPLLSSLAGLVTLGTILAATYLLERHALGRTAGDLPLVLPFDDATELVWNAVEATPTMLVFWVVGVVAAIRIPASR